MTVAEKIRSLTDEQLAAYLLRYQIASVLEAVKVFAGIDIDPPSKEQKEKMRQNILNELKQEVIDDDERR